MGIRNFENGTLYEYTYFGKHKGELISYLFISPTLEVLVPTEISSRKIEMMQNVLNGYNCMPVKPNQNENGGC